MRKIKMPAGLPTVMHTLFKRYIEQRRRAAQYGRVVLLDLDGVLAGLPQSTYLRYEKELQNLTEKDLQTLKVKQHILWILRILAYHNFRIYILSSRAERLRKPTERWLRDNGVPYEQLFMRPAENESCAAYLKMNMIRRLRDLGVIGRRTQDVFAVFMATIPSAEVFAELGYTTFVVHQPTNYFEEDERDC